MSSITAKINSFGIRNKKLFFTFAKVAVTIGLIYYLVNFIEYNKILAALKDADYRFVVLTFMLTFVNIYLQYAKWKLVCEHTLKIRDKKLILKSLFYGITGGIITPFKVGEFFARSVPLKKVSTIEVTLATAIDKLFPLIVVSFVGGLSTILFIHFHYSVSVFLTLSLFIVFFVLFYFVFLLLNNKKFWDEVVLEKLSSIKFLSKHITKFKLIGSLSPQVTWKISFITLLYYFTFTTQMALLIAAFLNQYDILNYLWVSNLVIFSQTVIPQVSIAELGVREGSTVFFMGLLGLSQAAGFNAAIFLFITNLVLPALIGAFLIIKNKND